ILQLGFSIGRLLFFFLFRLLLARFFLVWLLFLLGLGALLLFFLFLLLFFLGLGLLLFFLGLSVLLFFFLFLLLLFFFDAFDPEGNDCAGLVKPQLGVAHAGLGKLFHLAFGRESSQEPLNGTVLGAHLLAGIEELPGSRLTCAAQLEDAGRIELDVDGIDL